MIFNHLKEDVVHAGTIEDPIPQKLIFVKKDSTGAKKVYTLGMGGTTGGSEVNVSPATDIVTGIVKLTDDHNIDAPAATGSVAITPNGVKTAIETAKTEITDGITDTVNGVIDDALADGGKLDTAIDEALKDSIADGSLDDAINGAVDDVVNDKIESGEIGGSGDGSSSLVLKPGIIAPLEGASNVSVMVQLQASTYKCLLESEQRLHREFEIATVAEPSETKFTKEINADTVSVDSQLDPQTQFKWRCHDVTVNGLRSAWTAWTTFTTGNAIQVDTPTVTCSEGTTDVPETPTFTASAFAITPDQGDTASQHQSTTWRLLDVGDENAQVWQSENDTANKTSITLARGTLQAGKTYIMQAIYNSVTYGSSAAGSVQFTTTTEFTHIATPTITITGGAVNVGETPVFNGSAFTVEPSGSDTHVASTWVVTKKPDNSEIYRLDRNAVQKTTLTLPGSLLAEGQSYTVSLIYHGQTYGDSAAGTLDFSCAETFKGIKAPTLSLQGANDDGLVDYAASYVASQFEYIGGEDTCDKVDWELYKGDDKVWFAANSTILRYLGSFGDYTLEPSTAYVLKYRQHAKTNDVWSAWAELNFTTVSEFTAPTLKFKMTQPNAALGASAYINLKDLFLWWDSSKFHVYKDGALDASLTSNIDQSWIVGDVNNDDLGRYGDTIIEIKRIDGQNKYPYLCFNGVKENKSYFKQTYTGSIAPMPTGHPLTLEILSPLPTLYSAEEGEPVKEFAGGYAEGVIGGPFYDCATLKSLPSDLFKFNPQITTFGGLGGGGGGGGGGGAGVSLGGAGAGGGAGGIGGGLNGIAGNGGDSGHDGRNGGAGGVGYGCFTNCSGLTTIPENLFAYCPNIINFGGIGGGGGGGGGGGNDDTASYGGSGGNGGAGGTGYGCFTNCSGLTSIPESLFTYCPNAINFGGINGSSGGAGNDGDGNGYGDGGIGGDGGAGGTGYGCFANCSGLTSIPENLFAYCPSIVNLLGVGSSGGGGGGGGAGSYLSGAGGTGGGGGTADGGGGGVGSHNGADGSSVVDFTTPHNDAIPASGKGIFAGCTGLTTVPQNLLRHFGTTNNVVGANLIGTFEGCSKLSATLYFDATNIAQGCVKNFASGNKAAATVFAKSASTTYNSFHDETTANCNVIPF